MASAEELLKPLRGMYLAQLRERANSVDAFLVHCRSGAVPDGERTMMASLAHKLAGSGTTYGFPLITQTARALEDALADPAATPASLAPLAESLAHSCQQAVLSIERDSSDPVTRTAPPPAARPVLLAIDDDPVVRETITSLFGRDFEVVTAPDGETGLREARERAPRLVLVDEIMPGMTGVQFVEALRAGGGPDPEVPVIMVTAMGKPQDVVRALAAGVSDYIVKPFAPEVLAEKVRDLLHRSGRMVLVADDDDAIRDLLAYKFRLAGVRVLTAADGEEAYRIAAQYRPHLAILDRMMPGLDGVAVLRKLREKPETAGIPVLFLTALRQEKDILEGFRIGVADYVIKPFLPEEVLARGLRLMGLEAR